MHAELRLDHDARVSRKRVARLMRRAGLSGSIAGPAHAGRPAHPEPLRVRRRHPVTNVEFDGHVQSTTGGGTQQDIVYELKPGRTRRGANPSQKTNDYIEYPESALPAVPTARTPSRSVRSDAWKAWQFERPETLRPIMNWHGCHHRTDVEWRVFDKLSKPRQLLDEALIAEATSPDEVQEIESLLDAGPYWGEGGPSTT